MENAQRYIAVDVQTANGEIIMTTGEMKIALDYIQDNGLTTIDQDVVGCWETGENIVVITVE